MNKVVILGRGGAGKSTLAVRLGAATGLPVVELDKHFWRWLIGYRRRSLPLVMAAIADHAQGAAIHLLHSPREVDRLLSRA